MPSSADLRRPQELSDRLAVASNIEILDRSPTEGQG